MSELPAKVFGECLELREWKCWLLGCSAMDAHVDEVACEDVREVASLLHCLPSCLLEARCHLPRESVPCNGAQIDVQSEGVHVAETDAVGGGVGVPACG